MRVEKYTHLEIGVPVLVKTHPSITRGIVTARTMDEMYEITLENGIKVFRRREHLDLIVETCNKRVSFLYMLSENADFRVKLISLSLGFALLFLLIYATQIRAFG